MTMIDLTRDELRQLERLIAMAEGRFPDAFYTAAEKITAALAERPTLLIEALTTRPEQATERPFP